MKTNNLELVSNAVQLTEHLSNVPPAEQSDEALTFARQCRDRFGDKVALRYHANGDAVRGKRPYWWAEVAR